MRMLVRVGAIAWVLVVLCVGGRVVMMMVVVRRWVLRHLAVLRVMRVVLGLCRVVQVGRVGFVGDECGVARRR